MNKVRRPAVATITISYSFLFAGFAALLLLMVLLRYMDQRYNLRIRFTEYIQIGSLGAVTIGLIYNSVSLQYNYCLNQLKLDREEEAINLRKIKLSYDITSAWFKGDMANNAEIARRFIAPYKGALKQHDKLEEFKMKLEISSGIEERRALVAILNYFECISLLLEDDLIDEAILKKCFKTTFRTYYINLKEFIEDWQRGNDGANHRIFINFVALAKKWNETE